MFSIKYFDFGINSESKNIYIQSQIHGNETFSTLVVLELLSILSMEKESNFRGKIRIVPRINPYSWFEYLYNGNGRYNPLNGIDWNRSYNWLLSNSNLSNNRNSLLSDCVRELVKGFNYIWDIHTPENGIEHVYTHKFNKNQCYFGIQNIIEFGNPTINSLDESCIRLKLEGIDNSIVDALTLELPSFTHATNSDVVKWAKKIYEEIVLLGIIKNSKIIPSYPDKYRIGELIDYYSYNSGIIKHYFELGQFIENKSNLFSIIPFDYEDSSPIVTSTNEGYPICIRRKSMIQKGDWVVRILNVKHYEDSTN